MPDGAEDSHWVWELKAKAVSADYFSEIKYLCLEGSVDAEAAIWIGKNAQPVLEKGFGAIYVSMLAVAPWNRHSALQRRLRGVY